MAADDKRLARTGVVTPLAYTAGAMTDAAPIDLNLHSPQRRLIELRMAHADLDALIDRTLAGLSSPTPLDELTLRRLKKRRLALRDQITQLEAELEPPEPA